MICPYFPQRVLRYVVVFIDDVVIAVVSAILQDENSLVKTTKLPIVEVESMGCFKPVLENLVGAIIFDVKRE